MHVFACVCVCETIRLWEREPTLLHFFFVCLALPVGGKRGGNMQSFHSGGFKKKQGISRCNSEWCNFSSPLKSYLSHFAG
mgnify:CR=1 FL=1